MSAGTQDAKFVFFQMAKLGGIIVLMLIAIFIMFGSDTENAPLLKATNNLQIFLRF